MSGEDTTTDLKAKVTRALCLGNDRAREDESKTTYLST